jgi:bacteriocin leader peptide (microcyclamide/patellamide family)
VDKQSLMPQAAQPVNRIITGQLPAELAELSEEALQLHNNDSVSVSSSMRNGDLTNMRHCTIDFGHCYVPGPDSTCLFCHQCSYDGDDAE